MPTRPLLGAPRVSCDNPCHLARGSAGGTDYAVNVGTATLAPFTGTAYRGSNTRAGWYLSIVGDNGHTAYLMHLSAYTVPTRTRVAQGAVVGATGGRLGDPGAGSSTGPHLHAHVLADGIVYGMEEYLARYATAPAGVPPVLIPAPPRRKERRMILIHHVNGLAQAFHLVSDTGIYLVTDSTDIPKLREAYGPPVEVTGPNGLDPFKRVTEAQAAIAARAILERLKMLSAGVDSAAIGRVLAADLAGRLAG